MKHLFLTIVLLAGLSVTAFSSSQEYSYTKTDVVRLKKGTNDTSNRPKAPAYSPLYCVVTNEDVTVYCEYETTGDILIVDSRTGRAIASETGVELGEGYTVYIPESESETPLTIYVTLGDITYWAEI